MSSAACQIAYLEQMDVPRLALVATEAAYVLGGCHPHHSRAVTRFLLAAIEVGLGRLWSREAECRERWWRCGHCGDRVLGVRSTDDHYCRRCCRLSSVAGPPATCRRYGLTLAGYSFGVDGEAYADAPKKGRRLSGRLNVDSQGREAESPAAPASRENAAQTPTATPSAPRAERRRRDIMNLPCEGIGPKHATGRRGPGQGG